MTPTSRVTVEQLATANYGVYPEDHKSIIERYWRDSLKDPDSAMFEYETTPMKSHIFDRGQPVFGYVVDYKLNAKNGFGAYTGYEERRAFIHDGSMQDATRQRLYEMYHGR